MLTDRTFIELLEYVLLNAAFPGLSVVTPLPFIPGLMRVGWRERPLDEPDDVVSSDPVPCSAANSDDVEVGITGTGGIALGDNSPFLVEDLDLGENKSLALGAEATRRMNRGNAPSPFDDRGRWAEGGVLGLFRLCSVGSAGRGSVAPR